MGLRGVAMVVAQHATEPLAAPDRTVARSDAVVGFDDPVAARVDEEFPADDRHVEYVDIAGS